MRTYLILLAVFLLGTICAAAVGNAAVSLYYATHSEETRGHIVCPHCHRCLGHIDTIASTTVKTDKREIIETTEGFRPKTNVHQ